MRYTLRLILAASALCIFAGCRSSTRSGTTYSATQTFTYTTSLPGASVGLSPYVLPPGTSLPPGLVLLLPTQLDARITGIVLESVTGEFTLGDFDEISASPAMSDHLVLAEGSPIETPYPLRITLEQSFGTPLPQHYEFTAIVAPAAPTTKADAVVHGSPPGVLVEEGWGFLWGRRPRLMSRRVLAEAIGTTIALEQVDGETHRVYIMHDTDPTIIKVSCVSAADGTVELGPQTITIPASATDKFVDVTFPGGGACGSIGTPADVVAGTAQADFVARAGEIASKAGWTP